MQQNIVCSTSEIRHCAANGIKYIETLFHADAVFFFGYICSAAEHCFRNVVETLRSDSASKKRLVIVFSSPGGGVESVEKLVRIIRYHYQEVFFVIPQEAMSAGAVFALSGDRIYMDYASSLGPIDPQICRGNEWVSVMDFLDKVERIIEKSSRFSLTDAEKIFLRNIDLAELSRCEQAKALTFDLVKKWLMEYHYRDWTVHERDFVKKGRPVTYDDKIECAHRTIEILSNKTLWRSYSRKIGIEALKRMITLNVHDFSHDEDLSGAIHASANFVRECFDGSDMTFIVRSKSGF
ncbi:serine dehydrogenasease [Prosthecochloris sp. ZM_2]|nr:serine dehydrogenasease [Prosthecochloris sp. ZM_2]